MKMIDGDYPETIEMLGQTLNAVGRGKYPYDCISKDEFPNAMIYHGEHCWEPIQSKKEQSAPRKS